MLPDRLRADVVEGVEESRDRAARLRLRQAGVSSEIGEQDRRVDFDLTSLHHPLNIVSQIVQMLGFMRLGRMPTARYGTAAMVRKAIGIFMFCQQPTQERSVETPLVCSHQRRAV